VYIDGPLTRTYSKPDELISYHQGKFVAVWNEGIVCSAAIAPVLLNLGTRETWAVSFTPRPFETRTSHELGAHWSKVGWTRLCRKWNHDFRIEQPVVQSLTVYASVSQTFFKWGPLLLARMFYGPSYSCPFWKQIYHFFKW
jgi:hypothetical protein